MRYTIRERGCSEWAEADTLDEAMRLQRQAAQAGIDAMIIDDETGAETDHPLT